MFNGNKLLPSDYARTEFGIDLTIQKDVSIKSVRASFKKKCGDRLKYFIETSETTENFPIVLRPIDVFVRHLKQKESYTRDELEQVYLTDKKIGRASCRER